MNAHELFDRMLCLLFPPRCVICQELCAYDDIMCGKCSYKLSEGDADSKVVSSGASGAVAFIVYDDVVSKAMVSYKKYGSKRATDFFCDGMSAPISERWGDVVFDAVAPVPMGKKQRRKRGFNHAELLANGLSGRLGVTLRANVLRRSDESLPQHTLAHDERDENAKRSFTYGDTSGIKGLNMLLIDDIITTGATARSCSRLLLEAGAKSVFVVAAVNVEDWGHK